MHLLTVIGLDADLSAKRKIEKHREKVLRYESVLQKNPFVQAVPSSIRKKSSTKREAVPKLKENTQDGLKVGIY